ncbi:hypothetical protein QFZ91_005039 [Paraburkholderia sp. JPY419]
MHHLNTRENDARTPKILEAHHWSDDPFDRPMVLFHEVVQVFVLPDPDRGFALGVDGVKCGQIRAAFVDSHRLGFAIEGDRFFEISPRRSLISMGPQQEVDGVASLVDGAIQVFPLAIDLNVGLIDAPTLADGAFAATKRLFQHRQQLEGPTMHG